MKKKRSNIERFHHAKPDPSYTPTGRRPFSRKMWTRWLMDRLPHPHEEILGAGIEEFRRLIEQAERR